jgi:hypothetical protein
MISKNDKLFNEYLHKLVDKIYKILCLYEEGNEGLTKNIHSLIFELNGLTHVVKNMLSADYIVLLATLESLYDEALIADKQDDDSYNLFRREVFKCISIVKKIGESATESGEE